MPESSTVLIARNLGKVFTLRRLGSRVVESFAAVDDVSFDLCEGGSLAVVGESGSGKSTIARMVMGLEIPTSGSVELPLSTTGRGRRGRQLTRARHMQMVFQDPYSSLDPRQTVGEAIMECLQLHFPLSRNEARERMRGLLADVGLDERHANIRPRGLSGGERQRVAIAKALAPEPRVLVLDEAVAALDVSIQAQILNLLADIRVKRNIAILFISHDLAVVEQICDEVIVMRRGTVVERGRVETVLKDPQHAYTQRLVASVPRPGWKPRRRDLSMAGDDL
ncbi:hypothetical protein GCM10027416_01800 [Okibacterium endophyticum]